MIIKNAICYNFCGGDIKSKQHYDYVENKCGACVVDGGYDS